VSPRILQAAPVLEMQLDAMKVICVSF